MSLRCSRSEVLDFGAERRSERSEGSSLDCDLGRAVEFYLVHWAGPGSGARGEQPVTEHLAVSAHYVETGQVVFGDSERW